jgi:multidrug resistance efflux pump
MARPSEMRAGSGAEQTLSSVRSALIDNSSSEPPPETDAADSRISPVISQSASVDVFDRIALLKEAFETPARPEIDQPPQRWQAKLSHLAQKPWTDHRRFLKTAVGLLIAVTAGWMPVRSLLETTSTEAVINARLVTLRAPIEGEIAPTSARLAVGTELQPGDPFLRIINRRAERGRLDDLRRLIAQLESERLGLLTKQHDLSALHDDLIAQTAAFQDGRTRQLNARMAELRSEIAAADANREEAERALARYRPLVATGTITKAAFEKAKRDAVVTTETHAALGHRLAGIEVELAALKQGSFVGDSYNDRPRSSQRADEVAQRLSEVTADLRERESRLVGLNSELGNEEKRYSELASVDLPAPVHGSIWEVLTSPGESVVRGQDLARVLDCSGMVVTATVGETAYNRLRVGDRARFRFRGDHIDYEGRIIGMTGVGSAPANLAIQPAALTKEPYRATVTLPDLTAAGGQCGVGRTGRLTFER